MIWRSLGVGLFRWKFWLLPAQESKRKLRVDIFTPAGAPSFSPIVRCFEIINLLFTNYGVVTPVPASKSCFHLLLKLSLSLLQLHAIVGHPMFIYMFLYSVAPSTVLWMQVSVVFHHSFFGVSIHEVSKSLTLQCPIINQIFNIANTETCYWTRS
jgi:hypothetical protein